jgi:hypothetical protein
MKGRFRDPLSPNVRTEGNFQARFSLHKSIGFKNSIDLRRVFLCYVNISTRIFGDSVSCLGLYGGCMGRISHTNLRNRIDTPCLDLAGGVPKYSKIHCWSFPARPAQFYDFTWSSSQYARHRLGMYFASFCNRQWFRFALDEVMVLARYSRTAAACLFQDLGPPVQIIISKKCNNLPKDV